MYLFGVFLFQAAGVTGSEKEELMEHIQSIIIAMEESGKITPERAKAFKQTGQLVSSFHKACKSQLVDNVVCLLTARPI